MCLNNVYLDQVVTLTTKFYFKLDENHLNLNFQKWPKNDPKTFTLSVFSLYSLYSTRSFNQNNVDYCNLTLPCTLNTTHNNEVSMVSACHLLVATSKTTIILYFSRVYLLLLLLLRHKLKYISWARSRFSPISTHKHFGTSGSKYSSS